MNELEKILEEIEEKFKTADAEKCDCEELCDVEDWYDSGYIDGQLSAHEKCMDIIRSHMDEAKDANAPSNDGWIPVEEELPKKPKYLENSYIVQTNDIIDPFSAYWDGKEWTDVNDDPVKGVIAWQPLPEQYKSKVKTKE